jgi:type VI secretion system protein ImpF
LFIVPSVPKISSMAERDLPDGFQPSIFDKLTDADSVGTSDRRGYTETQLIHAVRRDLEDILNTRRPGYEELGIENLEQVKKSVIGYGLPDFANMRSLSDGDRADIGRQIAEAVAIFEPRLTDIEVVMKDPSKVKNELKDKYQLTAVYFHIAAKLRMDPCPPVTFETVLELTQGRHRIEGEHGGTS